jgi:hypothetical protein
MFIAMVAAEVSASAPMTQPLVEPNPKTMTQREIKAFNASIPKDHPFHIRCVSTVEIGTLAKMNYSCRTNRQWALADDVGNRNARDTYEAMQGKATNTN